MAQRLTENRVAELRAADAELGARLARLERELEDALELLAALVAAERAAIGAKVAALKAQKG